MGTSVVTESGSETAGQSETGRETSSKRFLLIAFDFPPRRTSGVYRPTGMTKYLARMGWKPTVLTVKTKEGDLQDPALLERIPPAVEIVRTRYFDFTRWEEPAAAAVRGAGALQKVPEPSRSSLSDRWLRRMGEFLRSCLYFPDESAGWIPFGLAGAIRLHREHPLDAIYTSSPPRSSLVIGLLLKMLFGVRWVAEFRDPWYESSRPIRRWFEARLLRLIAEKADALVVVTPGHREDLIERYRVRAAKIHSIPNGFDEEDFDAAPCDADRPASDHFQLTHIGTIYPECSGRFFEALRDLTTERPELAARMRVNIVGYPDEVVQRWAGDARLAQLIRLGGFVPHQDALRLMRASDCLLLFWGNPDFSRLAVAGKTYEYLRVGRPILAVTREGGIQQLLDSAKAGWAAHPEDVEGIKKALVTILEQGRQPQLHDPARKEFVAQFAYHRLAARLSAILEGVSKRGC